MALYDNITEKKIVCPTCGCPYLYSQEVNTYMQRVQRGVQVLVKTKTGTSYQCTECHAQALFIKEKGNEIIQMGEHPEYPVAK